MTAVIIKSMKMEKREEGGEGVDLNVSYRFYEESFIAYIQVVTFKITDIMTIRHRE